MKLWPYCEGHSECHDSRTRQYVLTGTGYGPPDVLLITMGAGKDSRRGIRLCVSHALLRFRAA